MVITIYGKRKQGKSTLALSLAVTEHNVVVVFDPNHQFVHGFTTVPVEGLDEFLSGIGDTQAPVLVRVGPFLQSQIDDAFTVFSDTCWKFEDLSVIVDETSLVQDSHYIHSALDRWLRRTPIAICFIQTTHRLVDTHMLTRYHTDEFYFFFTSHPKELKSISDNFGMGAALAGALPELKRHQVVRLWTDRDGRPDYEVWPDGKVWFLNLGNSNQMEGDKK